MLNQFIENKLHLDIIYQNKDSQYGHYLICGMNSVSISEYYQNIICSTLSSLLYEKTIKSSYIVSHPYKKSNEEHIIFNKKPLMEDGEDKFSYNKIFIAFRGTYSFKDFRTDIEILGGKQYYD